MLSALTLKQLDNIIANLPRLIEGSFTAYENLRGKFEISSQRKLYQEIYYDLFRTILFRIQDQKPLTILPLYDKLAFLLVNLQFNVPLFIELLFTIQNGITQLILSTGGRNNQLEQYIEKYVSDINIAITQEKIFQSGLEADQLIQLVEEYAPSAVVIKDVLSPVTLVGRTLYPLFDEDRYWEVQKEKYIKDSFYSTRTISIYNGKVYTLNQDIFKPTVDRFNFDEWGEFRSKFLIRSSTFNEKLKQNLEVYVNEALENAEDINGIISDSKIEKISSSFVYDENDLKLTFAGEGKAIIENLIRLKTTLNYFGNYEGSPVGNVDFVAEFCEYLYASCYGRKINNGFTDVGGINLLGNFNLLFSYGAKTNRIAGLKFLETFKSLKSFKQGVILPPDITLNEDANGVTKSATYNPVYAKYAYGVKDRYVQEQINPYMDSVNVDLLLFGIEQLSNITNRLGDTVEALRISLNKDGVLPGYEGLGPVSIQIEELSKIFISTTLLETTYANSKILPGFNGLLRYLKNSYSKLYSVLSTPPLTGTSIAKISVWGRKVQGALEKIVSTIENIGYTPQSFIPNISFKISTVEKERLIDQLRSLNFQESEIDLFLSAESFEDLLLKFAPVSNAADQISFFRAYELSQLIYEFGGESAIDAYINYLYLQDENNLANLLSIATKNKTSGVTYNESRYGKLVGLLINLTFSINPDQLLVFKRYLAGNDLTLFESISYLLQNKEASLLLDKEKINLLKPLAESLIYGKSMFGFDSYSIDYLTANEEAPLALKKWTEIIDKNLGNAATNMIENLYNKSQGLTTRELISILNVGSAHNHNDYGQLIDGYYGGRLTKLINYGYLSGLLHKLSYYSNSYQVPNFYISGQSAVRLDALVNIMKSLIGLLDITLTNFVNSLEYDLSQDSANIYSFENLINAQNKKVEEISKIIKDLIPINGDLTALGSPTVPGEAEIISSPGTGNSPVPESISKENSITPDQASLLSPQIKNNFSFVSNRSEKDITSTEVINKFIKFIEDNKLIVGVSARNTIVERNSNIIDELNAEGDQKLPVALAETDRNAEIKLPATYRETLLPQQIELEEVGNLLNQGLISRFDAIESCKRFGGENCESRISENINTCGDHVNKSIYSQRDQAPFVPLQNGSIPIDRPYGSLADIKPAEFFLPYSSGNKPAYFDLLGDNVKISNNGNPIIENLSINPLVFTKNSGKDDSLYPSYYNSEYGLIESIKVGWEKDEPFKCALLEDPYAFQACMNLLKCKRFKREDGIPSLSFCPKTLAGGLLK